MGLSIYRGAAEFEFATRRRSWFHKTPRLVFISTDGTQAIEFDPQKHEKLVIDRGYVKQGKWSYHWWRLRIPEGVIALVFYFNDHDGRFTVTTSWEDFFQYYKVPDTPVVREIIRKVAPVDARAWDNQENIAPTLEDVFV